MNGFSGIPMNGFFELPGNYPMNGFPMNAINRVPCLWRALREWLSSGPAVLLVLECVDEWFFHN
jgi:hypothetical protein